MHIPCTRSAAYSIPGIIKYTSIILKKEKAPIPLSFDLEDIKKIICFYYEHSIEEITKKDRHKDIQRARHVLSYFLYKYSVLSTLKKVGDFLGGKNHATVINSLHVVNDQLSIDNDNEYALDVKNILNHLTNMKYGQAEKR